MAITLTSTGAVKSTRILSFEISDANRRRLAFDDIKEGAKLWRLWTALGWTEILQRYKRSVLGPFWLTASMAVMVISLGFLYSELFKQEISTFMPFFCIGLLVWGFISSVLNEAGMLFCSNEFFIKQIRLPFTLYVWKFIWSRTIIFAHNFVIYLGLLAYFQFWPGLPAVAAFAGFVLIMTNALLVSTYLGMISTRFRDVPQIVSSSTQVIFFLTPVLWKPELLGRHRYIADWNPFYHLIEIVRAPLLGQWPAATTIMVVFALTLINFVVAAVFFPRFRARIAYWI